MSIDLWSISDIRRISFNTLCYFVEEPLGLKPDLMYGVNLL